MPYDEIITRTKEIIEDYYKKRRPRGKHPSAETFIAWLTGEHRDLEALSLLGSRDVEERKLPKELAREIVLFWRKGGRPRRDEVTVVVDLGPQAEAGRLDPGQLVDRYDPDLQPDAFGKRLAEIASSYTNGSEKAPKFLIFHDETANKEPTINKTLTKSELEHLKGVGTGRDVAIYDFPYETFAVGDRPNRYIDQSPWDWQEALYEGKSNAGVDWGSLPLETRQLIFIASAMVKEPDLQKFTEFELFTLLEKAETNHKGKSFTLAGRLFPKSFVQFKEYKRQQHLPAMKVAIGSIQETSTPTTN